MTGMIPPYQRPLHEFTTANGGAALTIDFPTNGLAQAVPLTAATCAFTFTAPLNHGFISLSVIQDATGGRLFTVPGSVIGTVPTPASGANVKTAYLFWYNGSNYYCIASTVTASGSGVTSWNSRTGAVVPAAGDYAASGVNNDSTVTGTHVSDALTTLKNSITALITGVSTVFGRAGAVVAVAGDYPASKINNDSATVSGTHVSDALDSLEAAIVGATAGVASFIGRAGAVVAVAGDYPASKINNDSSTVTGTHVSDALDALKTLIVALAASNVSNDSSVTGTTVKDALNTLNTLITALVTGVSSVYGRTGGVVAVAGDYPASKINNDSATVTGVHVNNALDALKASITALVTGVSTVYGRSGAVVATAGDYVASKVNNDSSTVTGTHVSDALDALKASITALVTGVSSVYGRTGAIVATAGDYVASKVNNDSTVTGTHVSDALNTLKTSIAALVTGVSSVYGRAGAVVAVAGDYAASKINNDSATVTGTHVSDALDTLMLQYKSTSTKTTAYTFALADVASLIQANSSGSITFTIPANATVAFKIGSRVSVFLIGTGTVIINGAVGVTVNGPATLPAARFMRYDCEKTATDTWEITAHGILDALDILDTGSLYHALGNTTVRATLNWIFNQFAGLTTTQVGNSSFVSGAQANDALNSLLNEYPNGAYNVSANFTLSRFNIGELGINNASSSIQCTIPTLASSGIVQGAKYDFILYAVGSALTVVGAALVTVHQPIALPTAQWTKITLEAIGPDVWLVTSEVVAASQFSGKVSIQQIAAQSTGWTFNGAFGSGWAGNGTGNSIIFAVGPVPPGASMVQIDVDVQPRVGHTVSTPATMPTIRGWYHDPGSSGWHGLASVVTDTSGSIAAYEAPHTLTLAFAPSGGNERTFWLEMTDEAGLHSLSGLSVVNISMTLQ